MTKKILSILCAFAVLVSMTALCTLPVSAANGTTKFSGFDKATCTLPDNLNWNSSGSGLFKTSGYGNGLIIGASNIALSLSADLGTYDINDHFKADFDIWFKNNTVTSGTIAGTENWVATFGDLAITFTRSPANINDGEGKNLYLKSVTYKGVNVTLNGSQNFSQDCVTSYNYNDRFIIDQANKFQVYLEERMIRKGWMFNNNFMPNCNLGVEVTYDAGELTVKNTTGNTVNTVTADLTSVNGFSSSSAFKETKVAFNINVTSARGTVVSIISDFNGVCDDSVVKPPVSQPSSSTGSSSSRPSNSSKPNQNSRVPTSSTQPQSSRVPTSSTQPQSSSATSSKAPSFSKDSVLTGTANAGNDLIIVDRQSNALTIIIIVVAACIVVAGGVVAFILLRKKNAKV